MRLSAWLRPVRTEWRRAFLVFALMPVVAVVAARLTIVNQFPGVILISGGLLAAYFAGPAVAVIASVEGILIVVLIGGLPNQHISPFGVVFGLAVIAGAGVGLSRTLRREREARAALEASDERYRRLLDASFDAVVLTVDGRIVEANEGFDRLAGLPPGASAGRGILEFIAPESVDLVLGSVSLRSTEPIEVTWTPADGRRLIVRMLAQTVTYRGQEARLRAITDVTDLRRAEADRAAVQQRYQALFESAAVGVTLATIDGVYLEANDHFCSMIGRPREAVVGHHFSEFAQLDERGQPDVREEILAGQPGPFGFEAMLLDADGREVPTRVNVAVVRSERGRPLYTVTVLESIAEQRLLELQVRQTQKMEAVGQLAGGIAHDFNNLLTVIGGNVLLLGMTELPDEAREHVDEIAAAADRAGALTRQLLSFSRAREPRLEPVDLNPVIARVHGLLGRLIGADIRIETTLAPRPARVQADPAQLEQVLINLALNARDAMPEGGTLSIGTEHAGHSVLLRVADTGIGMDAGTSERIFEPFFTTKGVGEGTGLGLTNVYSIVVQAGGDIAVESEPGAGTVFTIALPALDQAADPAPARPAPAEPPAATGRVLFVDDEAAVRRVAQAALQRAGHEPVVAASGAEALELLAAGPPVDLLVTDLSMPGMNGLELVERVRELHPGLAVLYVSGYADKLLGSSRSDDPGVDVLEKPFSPVVLAERVSRALAAR